MRSDKLVFVGQGPNQTAWMHGYDIGVKYLREYPEISGQVTPEGETEICNRYAENYCRRVAITGRIGLFLANLLDVDRLAFFQIGHRRNLNARFNGKKGKGDVFDRAEAKAKAAAVNAEPFLWHVLLGAEVQNAFGYRGETLEVRFDKNTGKNYLLFPHPSGINVWWNEPFNVHRAKKRLKEFVELAKQHNPE